MTNANSNAITAKGFEVQNFKIKNAEMKKAVAQIRKAQEAGEKSAWNIAIAVDSIVSRETWKDDFGTLGEVAKYLGMTSGFLSQCKAAVTYANNHEGFKDTNTVYRAYLMSTVEKEEQEFRKFITEKGLLTNSDSKLKKAVSEFNKRGTTPTVNKGKAEKVAIATDSAGVQFVTFSYNGKEYAIPMKSLAKYEVKKAEQA